MITGMAPRAMRCLLRQGRARVRFSVRDGESRTGGTHDTQPGTRLDTAMGGVCRIKQRLATRRSKAALACRQLWCKSYPHNAKRSKRPKPEKAKKPRHPSTVVTKAPEGKARDRRREPFKQDREPVPASPRHDHIVTIAVAITYPRAGEPNQQRANDPQ